MSETTVICTHDGAEHVWEPGAACPDAIPAGTWSVRATPLPPGRVRRSIEEAEREIASGKPLVTLDQVLAAADRIAAIEAAPDAEEALRVRVARAIADADGRDFDDLLADVDPIVHVFLDMADAAIRAICEPAPGYQPAEDTGDPAAAVARVEALAAELDREADSNRLMHSSARIVRRSMADRLRAALAGTS